MRDSRGCSNFAWTSQRQPATHMTTLASVVTQTTLDFVSQSLCRSVAPCDELLYRCATISIQLKSNGDGELGAAFRESGAG